MSVRLSGIGAAVLALLLSGCAVIRPRATGTEVESAAGAGRNTGPTPISRSYDVESLLKSVVQLDWYGMGVSSFYQFSEMGDRSFEDLLVRVFGLEPDVYLEGQGSRLVARDPTGSPFLILEKALIEKTRQGDWWLLAIETESDRMVLEVLVGVERAPLLIRYVSPVTGLSHEVVPEMGRQIEQARQTMTARQIRDRLDGDLANEVQQAWGFIFGEPELMGEEIIETKAGAYVSVHIRDTRPGSPPGVTDYWLSPDVPGQILRVIVTIPETTDKVITELEEIKNGVTRTIDPADVIPIN